MTALLSALSPKSAKITGPLVFCVLLLTSVFGVIEVENRHEKYISTELDKGELFLKTLQFNLKIIIQTKRGKFSKTAPKKIYRKERN